jgi:hypothetical protein
MARWGALAFLFVLTGCGGGSGPGVTGVVTPAAGGVLRTESYVLEVPPGAVDVPVTLRMTPIAMGAPVAAIAAVRIEPEGLELWEPAVLHFALPAGWPAGAAPLDLEFADSPNEAVPTGDHAALAPDGKSASLTVWHTGGKLVVANCHHDTRDLIARHLASKGCPADAVASLVAARFPAVALDGTCTARGEEQLQAVLDTFFDEAGGWNEEQQVRAESIAELTQAADEGRMVVLAFQAGTLRGRSGPSELYPGFGVTAALENRDGRWMLRSEVIGSQALSERLGPSSVVWWPLEGINEFRELPAAAAAELQACGSPGCLSPPLLALELRAVPWTAVRAYVQRPDTPACSD